ncbi:hypothetical protein RUW87_22710, partial [Klebsiella pneumoniae]|uniref:hypothetical protein n=1 Tax=Klebsiella pneumoniae TaxID=573 RepID=UPI0028FB74E2
LMMSLWDALRMNMMISYQELVRTFLRDKKVGWVIVLQWFAHSWTISLRNEDSTSRIQGRVVYLSNEY